MRCDSKAMARLAAVALALESCSCSAFPRDCGAVVSQESLGSGVWLWGRRARRVNYKDCVARSCLHVSCVIFCFCCVMRTCAVELYIVHMVYWTVAASTVTTVVYSNTAVAPQNTIRDPRRIIAGRQLDSTCRLGAVKTRSSR